MIRTIAIAAALAFAGAAQAGTVSFVGPGSGASHQTLVSAAVRYCQLTLPNTPLARYEMPYCLHWSLDHARTGVTIATASAFDASATVR